MPSRSKPALRSPRAKRGGVGTLNDSEGEGSTGQLRITLVKSPTGYNERQKRTARALGLRRLQQVVEHADTPAVRGMLAKIPHLVSVEPALSSPDSQASDGERGAASKGK